MPIDRPRRKSWQQSVARGRPFVKMHGLKNHFVIIDGRDEAFVPDRAEIVRICDPRVGVGADQLVVAAPPVAETAAGKAAASVRFWNNDGREVEACGNATRCVGWLLMEETGSDDAAIETMVGTLGCRRAGPQRVTSGMGRVSTDWRDVPLAEQRDTAHLDFSVGPLRDPVALSIGNPHLVFFVDDVDAIDLEDLAPGIQNDPLFPEQVNVGVAQMLSAAEMRLRVYERGAGLTMACGSGACAAAYAALARGMTASRNVAVELPGGRLEIDLLPDGSVAMTGPVAFCFAGWLPG